MGKKKLVEINSRFFLKASFAQREWFEASIKMQQEEYHKRYNGCIVEVYRNRYGARVVAYEERKNRIQKNPEVKKKQWNRL